MPLADWTGWAFYKIGRLLFSIFLILFCSFRWFGSARVPRSGPLLIIANHESFWDPPLVGVALGRRVTYMARKTLFRNPILSYFMRQVGTFTVDQEGTGMDGIRMAIKQLEAGKGVVIFPEGSRTKDGQLQPFMPGVALIIRKAKATVLPVGIGGSFHAWRIGTTWPKLAPLWLPPRRAAIGLVIGRPIPAEELLNMEPREMVVYLHDVVARLRDQAYRMKRKSP
jgi:1-acyl-sn-glycerol-3-phosphate acyltransferase